MLPLQGQTDIHEEVEYLYGFAFRALSQGHLVLHLGDNEIGTSFPLFAT